MITIIKSLFENNLNITQSSQVVYMHRNTINNKLDMIKRLTGLNIQNFKEAVAMYLLLNA
ncbi:MAG TPA: helix-turn-helix domain-containing protein [Bacilli bacterium]|nr:helix-turn-helix domain-containing protein [Bacilli bacterium]